MSVNKTKQEVQEARRESPSGYHFYCLYHQCPFKWALKYVYGLLPVFTSVPLIKGGIVHDATEVYFTNNWDIKAATDSIKEGFAERTPEFADKSLIPDLRNDAILMLKEWDNQFGYEKDLYKVVEVEKEHTFKIGPNKDFIFTVRMDRVMVSKETRFLEVRDTKTTGYSIGKSFQGADQEDQMTAYLWAAEKLWPKVVTKMVYLDILYKRGKVVKTERCGPIYRDKWDLGRFELELYGLINEVSQKYLALESLPLPVLFPRCGLVCSVFDCEYKDICRTPLKLGKKVIGFKHDPWVNLENDLIKAQESFNIELIKEKIN